MAEHSTSHRARIHWKCCLILLCAASAAGCVTTDPESLPQANKALVRAPYVDIGPRVEDWLAVLGTDYRVVAIRGLRNLHTRQPNVMLELTSLQTRLVFQIDIVRNDHFLWEIESTDLDFLDKVGVKFGDSTAKRVRRFEDCSDSGCWKLKVDSHRGKPRAHWEYYWD